MASLQDRWRDLPFSPRKRSLPGRTLESTYSNAVRFAYGLL
jgi:hypothetical protein